MVLGSIDTKGMSAHIIEWVVETIVIGIVVMYGSVQIIGTKLDDMGAQLTRIIVVQDANATRLRSVERISAVNSDSIHFLFRGKNNESQ